MVAFQRIRSLTPRQRGWLAVAVALLLALWGWLAWRPLPSEAVAVRAAPLVRTVQFSARVATLSRVDVGSTVTGRVVDVLVNEGDAVRPGQALVRLESDEAHATLTQAQATERQAQARLAGLRSTARVQAQAAWAQAEATSTAARAELARVQQLVAQGFVSGSRRDEAERVLAVAQAQQAAAQAQVQATADGGTDVLQAQAQAQAARAASVAAQARLDQTLLRAPTVARVLARDAEPGQIVQPGRALLSLALDGPTQLKAQVDERFLEQLQVGQTATVVADAYATQRLAARILHIAPGVDAQRGAVEVTLALDAAAPAFLREDMTLSVEVVTGQRERALVLPLSALRGAGTGDVAQVLVLHEGRATTRELRVGMRTLEAVEVLTGLAEGDAVLLAPTLQAGQRVRAQMVPWAVVTATERITAGSAGMALTNAIGR